VLFSESIGLFAGISKHNLLSKRDFMNHFLFFIQRCEIGLRITGQKTWQQGSEMVNLEIFI